MDEKVKSLKQIRARRLTTVTRLRRRALVLMESRGSRTQISEILKDLDLAMDAVSEANDNFKEVLKEESELAKADKYVEDIDKQYQEVVQKINEHLILRKDEPASVVSSVHQSATSSSASMKMKDAEIEARVKEFKLSQLERRIKLEQEEQELQMRRRLREASDACEAAKFEAGLRKTAESELNWERKDDFEGEDLGAAVAETNHPIKVQGETSKCGPEDASPTSSRADHRSCSLLARSLPHVTIPTFSGDPLEWPKWYGLFKSLVDDQRCLSDAEKLIHLQSAVTGLAEQCIRGMLFDPKLYPKAMETLQDRFGQEETIVHANINAIFSAASPSYLNAASLERYHATVNSAVTVLQNLGYHGDLESCENLKRVVEKLPVELRRGWGEHILDMTERPTLISFNNWLGRQVKIGLNFSRTSAGERRQVVRRSAMVTAQATCAFCGGGHGLESCDSFVQRAVDERAQFVASRNICFFCLKEGHRLRECRSAKRCEREGCTMRHHQLLHGSRRINFPGAGAAVVDRHEDGPQEAAQRTVASALSCREERTTLLQIVKVRVHGQNGKHRDVHAMLDPGAQTSLCCREVLEDLELDGQEEKLILQNVEGVGEEQKSMRVSLTLSPLETEQGEKIIVSEAFSVPRINVDVPKIPEKERQSWYHVRDLHIPSYDGTKVELLLGANVLEAVLQLEARIGRPNQPAAIRTIFGWTLTGTIVGFVPERTRQVMFVSKVREDDGMLQSLQQWWTTESFGTKFEEPNSKSLEDTRALKMMEKTTKDVGGRFETGLLWKRDSVTLPANKSMAVKRLQSLERSLLRQPAKGEAYSKVIRGYLDSGHARKLTSAEVNRYSPKRWYLPHHAVFNPNKPGKTRVVFDAAARYGGTSLNDELLSGPDLLLGLPGILIRFREERVAITGDVRQMYHQVLVCEEDQPALSFLWRDLDLSREPDAYQMMVTIFGAKSSPASANFALRKTAMVMAGDTEEEQRASCAVFHHFYMDDFLKSEIDVQSAKSMQKHVTDLLQRGGFTLTKWRSNEEDVLKAVSEEHRAHPDLDMPAESLLGYIWNPKDDTLSLRNISSNVPLTKRGVVQAVARLFDPLGLMCPVVVKAKLLVQRLWVKGYGWDDTLDEGDGNDFCTWLAELPVVESSGIPRCYKVATTDNWNAHYQLHVFADASEVAFGAVAYLRTASDDGRCEAMIIMAKSRVAPLKKLTIVRLELQAAVMAVRMANTIRRELQLYIEEVVFWSDSQVVLKYIQGESHRFHTFVANRIAEIRETSCPQQWRYVPSRSNPADACSRGESAEALLRDQKWFTGPTFLLNSEDRWPSPLVSHPAGLEGDPEVRIVTATSMAVSFGGALPSAGKYSCWNKYRRIVAWVLRFLGNFVAKYSSGKKSSCCHGPLKAGEIMRAEKQIVKDSQNRMYSEVVKRVRDDHRGENDALEGLSPFIDDDGLLRVGGRLDRAPMPFSARHPIIMHPKDPVTKLLIHHAHLTVLHSGTERTLTEIRSAYWIPKGRSAVKHVLHGCVVCRRRNATPCPPLMSELPECRFDCSRPFASVGLDYFGPFLVKKLRKTEKRYGVLFTCLSVRAVHIEVAHNLEADSLLMALRRFIARRGHPTVIFSDNGTNMVGGEREIRESLAELDSNRIGDMLSQRRIQWNFIPPGAPHMGGAWERMVGSVKRAFRVISSGQVLTDEVLLTLFTEVESMLNGRPLTYVSTDPHDMEPLTPNHFLLGCASPNVPPGVFRDKEVNSRRRWRQAQVLAGQFWKRWRQEYLPTLLQRQKWRGENRNMRVGDVVLMMDDNAPRGFWPLAKVIKVFEGADGRVRSVELKTGAGHEYHRPVTKVCWLEESVTATDDSS